ncbi:PTS sugar transporter subunit IIB [Brevibacillus sp. WF146]|uniref:PTS sugar transporter subunit IIB n=1 Tax=Brevibacillus sp. WF146 TaxID=319501 RepID=UPI0007ED3121|nr:PTS sugar transporter subunit IIB [Brevibacillus sp. WF146]UYZ12267.1 PTS sugar transporter subunit IIB [Brevibacillus sp. WF146]
MTKKVVVICGTGVCTSTVAMQKLKAFLQEKGINVSLTQSKVSDILTRSADYDLIVSTTAVPPSIQAKVINALPLLTGVGKDKFFAEVEAALAD